MGRIQALRRMFKKNGISAAVILSPENRYYFSGFESSEGAVVVTEKNAYLLVDFRYIEAAKNEAKNIEVILWEKDLFGDIAELLKDYEIVGIEGDYMTCSVYNKAVQAMQKMTLIPNLDNAISPLRQVKDKEELIKIEKAQEISENSFLELLPLIKEGMTERQIAHLLESIMWEKGSGGISFPTIVLFGENSSKPHGVPNDRKLKKGDFILMDFGATVDGYHADMSRTVAFSYATDRMKEIYSIVQKAQREGICKIHARMSGKQADAVSRDFIENYGYGNQFGHSLGHGVGLAVHEEPRFSPRCEEIIHAGTVMSIEPGIYLPQEFGVRIEDLIVVGEKNCRRLNKIPTDLVIL